MLKHIFTLFSFSLSDLQNRGQIKEESKMKGT